MRVPQLILAIVVVIALGTCNVSASPKGFSLGIRDSIMIAHAFKGKEFGPAQQLHGATYTVDVEFKCPGLVPKVNWVVDIGEASDVLGKILAKYNFKNLDDLFPEENTTTEFMCRVIHGDLCRHFRNSFKGSICVKLWESHKAWAAYEDDIEEEGAEEEQQEEGEEEEQEEEEEEEEEEDDEDEE